MKSLLFLLSATILVFITASAPVYAISWIVEPLIKIYPQIRGTLFFHLFIQFFDPWLIFFVGAFLISLLGSYFLQRKTLLYFGLLLIALCIGWPAGSVSFGGSLLKSIMFSMYFWIDLVLIGPTTFNIISWQWALEFFVFTILVFLLLSQRKHSISK
jgi:hypothetical protein